jgi:hypothetical protein
MTVIIPIEIKSNIKQATQETDGFAEALKRAEAAGKKAGKEIDAGTQVANAGVGMLRGNTGNLAKSFLSAGKAAKLSGKAMKAAMISSGIGIVVALVALLVEHWDKISGLMDGVTSSSKKNLEYTQETLVAQQDLLTALSESENSLRLQGKSEQEIRDLKRQQTEEVIITTEALLIQQKEQGKAQIAAANRNKKILKGLMKFILAPMQSILGMVDLLSQGLKKLGVIDTATTLKDSLTNWTAELIFDPDDVAEKAQATIDETTKTLRALKNKRDGFILQDQKDQEGSTSSGKDFAQELFNFKEKLAAEETALIERTELEKLEIERKAHIKSLDELKLTDIEKGELTERINKMYKTRETVMKAEAAREEAELLLQMQQDNALAIIEDEKKKAQKLLDIQYNKDLEALKEHDNFLLLKAELDAKYKRESDEITDAAEEASDEKAATRAEKMAAVRKQIIGDLFSAISSALKSESQALDKSYKKEKKAAEGNEKALAKVEAKYQAEKAKIAQKQKKVQLAQATITMFQSVIAAFNAGAGVGPPAGLILGPLAAAAALAAGLMNLKAIGEQDVGGGSSGSTPAGASASAPAPEMMSGSFELEGGQEVEPARAYVVSDDITDSQDGLALIRRRATI